MSVYDVTPPPLILVGGSVRAAAADAAAAGYRVVAIDRFGDRDLQAISERWYPLDDHWERHLAAWPAAPLVATGGFPWRSADRLRKRLIAFPTPDAFEALCDPEQLRCVAQRCGIGFPITIPIHQIWDSPASDPPGSPSDQWLIKPRFGAGGIGIRRWSAKSQLHTGAADAHDADAPENAADLQQWVAGRPLGVCYFARHRHGERLTRLLGAFDGLTYRKHRDWPWLYGGSFGPRRLSAACRQRLSRLGAEIASTFGLVGLFNVDLIRRRDGSMVLLEVNPRYSASMELLRLPSTDRMTGQGASLIEWNLAAYQEQAGQIDCGSADRRTDWPTVPVGLDLCGPVAEDPACLSSLGVSELACKRIVYAAAPIHVDCPDEELSRRFGVNVEKAHGVKVSFHDLPPIGTSIPAGAPALSVIVRGPQDAKTLVRTAHQIAADLRRCLRAP